MEKVLRTFWPGSVSLLAVTILLCLPGSTLPSRGWFEIVQLDKWVHVVLFAILMVLWSWPFTVAKSSSPSFQVISLRIGLVALAYGIIMEVVQHFWIPQRSFDIGDIMADGVGCAIGFSLSIKWLVKRIPR